MPMFILISGYLCKNKWSSKKLIRNYIVPYIIFDLLWAIYSIIRNTEQLKSLNILYPTYVYWFILCLFFLRIIAFIPKLDTLFFPLSIVALLITSVIEQQQWRFLSLGRVVLLYPMFYLGRNYARNICERIYLHKRICLVIISMCILVEIILLSSGAAPITWSTHDYPNSVGESVLKLIFIVITLCMFCCFSALLPKKQTILSRWGRNSLIVYLLHPFVVDMIKIVISKLHFRWDTAFFFAVFITSVIITEVLSEDWLRLLFDKFMNRLNILLRLND